MIEASIGVLGVVAIIVFGYLYAKRPSVKHGGPFREQMNRSKFQREIRNDVRGTDDEKESNN